MKRHFTYLLAAAALMLAVSPAAMGKNKEKEEIRQQKVYMFGFAASYVDSVAYMTDIQAIDSAYIQNKTGFLCDRALYGMQLQNHMEETLGIKNTTCVVYFHKNKSKLESRYLKIRDKQRKAEDLHLRTLDAGTFTFKAEEYIAPIMVDVPEELPGKPADRPTPPAGGTPIDPAKGGAR